MHSSNESLSLWVVLVTCDTVLPGATSDETAGKAPSPRVVLHSVGDWARPCASTISGTLHCVEQVGRVSQTRGGCYPKFQVTLGSPQGLQNLALSWPLGANRALHLFLFGFFKKSNVLPCLLLLISFAGSCVKTGPLMQALSRIYPEQQMWEPTCAPEMQYIAVCTFIGYSSSTLWHGREIKLPSNGHGPQPGNLRLDWMWVQASCMYSLSTPLQVCTHNISSNSWAVLSFSLHLSGKGLRLTGISAHPAARAHPCSRVHAEAPGVFIISQWN